MGDEVEGCGVDAAVGEACGVEFAEDEGLDVFGCEGVQECGVGGAAVEVCVDGECEGGEEFDLGEEEDAVVTGAFF